MNYKGYGRKRSWSNLGRCLPGGTEAVHERTVSIRSLRIEEPELSDEQSESPIVCKSARRLSSANTGFCWTRSRVTSLTQFPPRHHYPLFLDHKNFAV